MPFSNSVLRDDIWFQRVTRNGLGRHEKGLKTFGTSERECREIQVESVDLQMFFCCSTVFAMIP